MHNVSFPVVVRIEDNELALARICLAGAFLGAIGFTAWAMHGYLDSERTAEIAAPLVFLALSAGTAVALLNMINTVIVFQADHVEKSNLFRRSSLLRSQVRGYRRIAQTKRLRLESSNDASCSIAISRGAFNLAKPWFDGIVDLDAEELRSARKELREDTRFGTTPKERRERVALFRRIGHGANVLAFALAAWVMFFPRPYELAVLTAMAFPLLGLAVGRLSHGFLRIDADDDNKDPRPAIGKLLLLPALMLMLRVLFDYNFLDWQALLISTAVLAVAATLFLRQQSRAIRSSYAFAIYVLFGAAAYAFGAIAELDVLLDDSKPQTFHTTVRGLTISSGKHTSYEVSVDPWGPEKIDQKIDVTRAFYYSIHVGEPLCVYLWPGRFGVRWFDLGRC